MRFNIDFVEELCVMIQFIISLKSDMRNRIHKNILINIHIIRFIYKSTAVIGVLLK